MATELILNALAILAVLAASVFALSSLIRKRQTRVVPRGVLILLAVVGGLVTVVGAAILIVNPGSNSFRPEVGRSADSLQQLRRRQVSLDTLVAGVNLASRGRLNQAIQMYDVAIILDSTNSEAFGYRGYALYRLGKLDEALADTRRAARLDAAKPWHPYNEALILWDQRDTAAALAAVRRVIELDSSFVGTIRGDPQFRRFQRSQEFRQLVGGLP